ncbi:E3 ubiquitin-protein ligase TRIM71-like [Mytilus edulis]|uniref:E3 ubiquitin-protein ligase TRIM71-like n=1 Tax=Mytilus edulis TaxID=6550 RepID=UPI0039EE56D1
MAQAQVPVTNTCTHHPMQVYQFYCENDNTLACRLCVTGVHRGHTLSDLSEHAKSKRRELKGNLQTMKDELQLIKDEERQNNQHLDEMERKRSVISKAISDKAEYVKEKVEEAKCKLDEEFKALQKIDKTLLGNCKQKAATCREKLEKHMETIEKKLSNNDADLIHWISKNRFDPLCLDRSFLTEMALGKPSEYRLDSIEIDEKRMARMIGRFQNVCYEDHVCSGDEFQGQIELNTSVDFKSSFPNYQHVGTIVPVHGELAWIGFQRPGTLHLVTKKGAEKMKVLVGFDFKDMKITKYGDILVSEEKGFKVWRFTFCGRKQEFYDASPFITRCMCVTRNGEVLLCLHKNSTTGNGKIVKLSPTGKVMAEYSKNQNGREMFQKPDRIIQNVNDDFLVIDGETRAIQGFNSDFTKIKFTYNGSQNPAGPKPFQPDSVTNDRMGHLYIADYENHTIHVLQPDGSFITFFQFKELERNWPRRVAVDLKSFLWIGCNNAKLYTISLHSLGLQI